MSERRMFGAQIDKSGQLYTRQPRMDFESIQLTEINPETETVVSKKQLEAAERMFEALKEFASWDYPSNLKGRDSEQIKWAINKSSEVLRKHGPECEGGEG